MKNRRNTRRGRAKRWRFNGDFWWWWGRHGLAWVYRVGSDWRYALRTASETIGSFTHSRAAAMRAVEELVRRYG